MDKNNHDYGISHTLTCYDQVVVVNELLEWSWYHHCLINWWTRIWWSNDLLYGCYWKFPKIFHYISFSKAPLVTFLFSFVSVIYMTYLLVMISMLYFYLVNFILFFYTCGAYLQSMFNCHPLLLMGNISFEAIWWYFSTMTWGKHRQEVQAGCGCAASYTHNLCLLAYPSFEEMPSTQDLVFFSYRFNLNN